MSESNITQLDQNGIQVAVQTLIPSNCEQVLQAASNALTVTLEDISDLDGYKLAKKDASRFRKLRLDIDKRRKELVQPAVEFQRTINAEAKSVIEPLKAAEEHLKGQVQLIDNEKERLREQKRRARVQSLTSAGFTFDGYNYVAGMIVIPAADLPEIEDSQFDADIAQGAEFVKQERAKKAAEEEARRKEQEELEAKRRELAEQEERLRRQQAEQEAFKKWQADQEAAKASAEAEAKAQQAAAERAEQPRTVVTPSSGFPGDVAQAPAPEPKAKAPGGIDIPEPLPFTEFQRGFESAKTRIIKEFQSGTKRNRAQWIEWIANLDA